MDCTCGTYSYGAELRTGVDGRIILEWISRLGGGSVD